MEFYYFHLMPWPYLPADFVDKHESAWVTYSNGHFDSEVGHSLYSRYLDELELADRLGFDGVCVNEHHQTAYGLMPSPNLIAAMLTQRVRRARIAILGNAISLRDHPLRVAEEVAMLDVISGGRVISGFVRGIGCEYHSFGMDASRSRERFIEAMDLIIKAWTDSGPFEWHGKHYRLRYVNPWPRPLQRPHPPIWLPSTGSYETIELAASRGYPFIRVYERADIVKKLFDEVRAKGEELGNPVPPERLGWMVPIYVAETDAKAAEEAGKHVLYLFKELNHRTFELFLPPGYMNAASLSRALDRVDRRKMMGSSASLDDMMEQGIVIFGSAETVRQRLAEYQRSMQFGKLVTLLQFGSLPAELTRKNMEAFAGEVMPYLRSLGAAGNGDAGTRLRRDAAQVGAS
jgi:alkanesulfonate monooxygenase SsuD/methylene tetrahydromethanopterin reductase-like flavin-dependent oxidoreductase (luciferase family)